VSCGDLCSNELYKCAINPVINPYPVYKLHTPLFPDDTVTCMGDYRRGLDW
jgi:hypothetical protein